MMENHARGSGRTTRMINEIITLIDKGENEKIFLSSHCIGQSNYIKRTILEVRPKAEIQIVKYARNDQS